MSYQKRTALALASALAGTVVLMAAPAAHATVVDVDYKCKTPIGDKSAVSPIDIKSVKSGVATGSRCHSRRVSPPAPSNWARVR